MTNAKVLLPEANKLRTLPTHDSYADPLGDVCDGSLRLSKLGESISVIGSTKQRPSMERAMLELSLRDHILENEEVREE